MQERAGAGVKETDRPRGRNRLPGSNQQINQLWKLSGPCPGLGSALSALEDGFNGTLFALALSATLKETDDPWAAADKVFAVALLWRGRRRSPRCCKNAGHISTRKNHGARHFCAYLSRFELSRDQAIRWFENTDMTDAVLENPYLLYETNRFSRDPIGIWTIDRGIFPDADVLKRYPLPKECTIDQDEHDDPRRLRAIGIHLLEKAAVEGGHTLLGATSLHELAKELPATRPVPLDATAARLCKDEFGDEITVLDAAGVGGLALQLKRYTTYGSIIRRAITERVERKNYASKDRLAGKARKQPLARSRKATKKKRKRERRRRSRSMYWPTAVYRY